MREGFLRVSRIDFLDFLWGGAALMVPLGHMMIFIPKFTLVEYCNFLGRGVQLFYLISGYTLYMIYENKIKTKQDVIKFGIKRFFRIAPLFFILIPIYYFLFGLNLNNNVPNSINNFIHLFLHYTFLFGFLPESMISIIPPAWSIFVEAIFYITFAFIIWRIKSYILFIMVMFILVHVLFIFVSNTIYKNDIFIKTYIFFTPFYQMFVFFIGCAIYRYKYEYRNLNLFLCCGILFGCIMPFISYDFLSIWIAVLCFSCFLIYFSNKSIKFPNVMLFVGKISYSIYLAHMLVIDFFNVYFVNLNKFLAFFLCLLSIIALSSITYFLIEKRFIVIGNKILARYFK